jgi:hypothetical protein
VLESLLKNPAALAALAGVLVLAWRNRAALLAKAGQAASDGAAAVAGGTVEVRELTDNQALLERRMEVLQGMRYDAADLPDEAERTRLLKFLDQARDVARQLTPLDDVIPIDGNRVDGNGGKGGAS